MGFRWKITNSCFVPAPLQSFPSPSKCVPNIHALPTLFQSRWTHARIIFQSCSNRVPFVLCIRTHARNIQACNNETQHARTVACFRVLCIMLCLHRQRLWKRVSTQRRMHACCLHAARSHQHFQTTLMAHAFTDMTLLDHARLVNVLLHSGILHNDMNLLDHARLANTTSCSGEGLSVHTRTDQNARNYPKSTITMNPPFRGLRGKKKQPLSFVRVHLCFFTPAASKNNR